MPKAAAIYVRISEDQEGTGLGVARQEADCRKLAERLAWPVAATYTDNDVSAYSGRVRPSYRRLLDDLDAGRVDALIIWHADRLHRSPRELEDFIDLVERTGAPIQTVTAGERDLTTPTGRMHARIEGAVARNESEHKSTRIRRKHLELAENGQVSGGGRRPFGYESDRRTIRDDEAVLIREAVARILAGASLRSIVADWRAREVRTVTGADWSGTTVKRLLTSARIAGQRSHRGVTVADAEWPGIITPDQLARVRAVLNDPKRNRVAGVDARSYLLAGLVYCGRCGARMTTTVLHYRDRKTPRYTCHVDRGGCNRCGIAAAPLEAIIIEAVGQVLNTTAMKRALAKQARSAGAARNPVGDLESIDARRAELAALWAQREVTMVEWRAAREALDAEQRRVEAETVEHVEAARFLPADEFAKVWADPDLAFDQRRQVLGAVIDRITIAPTTKGGNKFDPDRVDIAWKV
jgi:DNA invertase Pin-like site-specific DNA recombinase